MHKLTSNGNMKIEEGTSKNTATQVLKDMDKDDYKKLKDAYYGVADNVDNLSELVNKLSKDTGEFKTDAKLALDMLKSYIKMDLGKYI